MGVLPLERNLVRMPQGTKGKIVGDVAMSRQERRKNGAGGNSAMARM